MQPEKTVLSLRPGGGTRGGSRVFGPRFEAAAANSDLPVLRPHGGGGAPSLKVDFFNAACSDLGVLNLNCDLSFGFPDVVLYSCLFMMCIVIWACYLYISF